MSSLVTAAARHARRPCWLRTPSRPATATATVPTTVATPVARFASASAPASVPAPEDLDAFWMPFTANQAFKQSPRILAKAKGMHYWTADGHQVLDGTAGLWCVNAGHCHEHIVAAIQKQAAAMDYAPTFNMGHPLAFEYAHRLCTELMPGKGLDQVFFTMCGSTAVDTALKIALAYHKVRGEGGRYRLIGRERAYHGVGFGGISVGGILPNRRTFGPMLPGVDHLRTTYDRAHQAFSKGQPTWGAHLAEDLERLVGLHDASTIAAVIVEPVSGSAGVLVPPHGYLKRLREICDAHGILLIFDEVITAFGRLGKGLGSEYFDVVPDIVTCAKGLTNAAVPAGATFVQRHVYDAFMEQSKGGQGVIELFHGYTYSGHPLAMAAGLATLDVYKKESLFERAAALAPYWEEALHALKGHPHVVDIRNLGLMGAVELAPRPGKPGQRAFQVFTTALHKGVMVRVTGDTIALSPPLIIEKKQIDQIVSTLSQALHEVA